jgi:hypothetical protein
MDGSNLEQLLLEAGFVDVKSHKIKIEIGDWGSASSFLSRKENVLIVDHDKELADTLVNVWSLALEALAEQMIPYIPNDEERTNFADGVKADIRNMDYQLYCYTYAIALFCSMIF